jgi:hypothetical protein
MGDIMEFKPDISEKDLLIPYFEEAKNEDGVIGYSTQKSLKTLKAEITAGFGRLGGSVIGFQSGKFGKRYGFRIDFTFAGVPGRMDIAALPIKKETESRVDKAKRHALYSVQKRLEAEYSTALIMPGDVPLMPYMLNSEGKTVLEVMREMGEIPALPESIEEDIIEGEFNES